MKNKKLIEILCLVFFGIFISLIVLELLLNICSFVIIHMKNQKSKNTEIEKNNEDIYTILILGESTTENNNGYSWPEQLDAYVNKNSQKVKIINKAQGGTTTALLLSYVSNYINEYNPDMIITMMGINDIWSYIYFANDPPSKSKLFFESLRVTKLFRLIYLNIKNNTHNKFQDNNKINKYVSKGDSLLQEGKQDEAKAAYKQSIISYPKEDSGYQKLGEFYLQIKDFNNSLIYLNKTVEINQKNIKGVLQLVIVLEKLEQNKEAIKLLEKIIPVLKNDPNIEQNDLDVFISQLISLYEEEKEINKIKTLIKERGFRLINNTGNKENNVLNITKLHYQLLFNITQDKNISLVIMQYPTRNIEDFKDFFTKEQQNNIIFIENKEIFKDALENFSYDIVFIDKFAFPHYSFGHCTSYGNSLIAKNLASKLLSNLNDKNETRI